MSMHPRVSVVMPAYNSAAHIKEALASARRQTLPPYEIIVVDDGSSDETAALARAQGARVLTQKNAGPAAARNAGVRAAGGEWIAFLDADDMWTEQKLERQLRIVKTAPQVGLIFGDFTTFDERGTHPRTGFDQLGRIREVTRTQLDPALWLCDRESLGQAFSHAMFMLTSTVLVRRDVLLGDDLFDVAMRCAEDYELFLRLVVRTSVAFVDEPLTAYRREACGITADIDLDISSRDLLLERCARNPQRYPASAAAIFSQERAPRSADAAFLALRSGRFAAARAHASRSLRMRFTFLALGVLPAACVCDNSIGRAAHAFLRRSWRQRPGKYLRVFNTIG
jgi:glycosyltransferase involved in cell wall biosynthesis